MPVQAAWSTVELTLFWPRGLFLSPHLGETFLATWKHLAWHATLFCVLNRTQASRFVCLGTGQPQATPLAERGLLSHSHHHTTRPSATTPHQGPTLLLPRRTLRPALDPLLGCCNRRSPPALPYAWMGACQLLRTFALGCIRFGVFQAACAFTSTQNPTVTHRPRTALTCLQRGINSCQRAWLAFKLASSSTAAQHRVGGGS